MNNEITPQKSRSHLIGGTVVLIIGLLFLLKNFDYLTPEMNHYIFSWKTLLIGIGLLNITLTKDKATGFILIAIGSIFWLPDVFDLSIRTGQLIFPIIIIAVGLMILFKKPRQRVPRSWKKRPRPWRHGAPADEATYTDVSGTINPENDSAKSGSAWTGKNENKAFSDTEFIEDVAIFSGTSKRIVTNNFRGGSMTAIFGGSELDLTRSRLAPGKNYLNVFFMFGGSEIIVPSDWNIVLEATPIFGGFSDERYVARPVNINENDSVLYIKGLVIFGGAEIKSY